MMKPCIMPDGSQGWRLGHSGTCYKTQDEAGKKLEAMKHHDMIVECERPDGSKGWGFGNGNSPCYKTRYEAEDHRRSLGSLEKLLRQGLTEQLKENLDANS